MNNFCTSPPFLHTSTPCLLTTLAVIVIPVVELSLDLVFLFRSEELKGFPIWDQPKYVRSSRFVGACTDVFQIMSRVDDLTEYQRYHVEYLGNLVFDNLVWHQSIVSLGRLQTFRGGLRVDPDDAVFSLGTNLSFPVWYIANTLQVNGQCSCDIPIWYIASTFRIFRTGFPGVFLVRKMPGTFTVFQVM